MKTEADGSTDNGNPCPKEERKPWMDQLVADISLSRIEYRAEYCHWARENT